MSHSGFGWKFEGAPGFGVQPSDEQLVNFYLKNKILGDEDDRVDIFPTVDVCMHEPWDLVELSILKDQPWHFYSLPKKKYTNSNKAERTTKTGYWKVTCKDCKIMDQSLQMQIEIGIKKTLVFYEGRFPYGKRTNWVMNEYHPTFKFPNQRDFVLCKIKNKHENGSTHAEGYGYETGSSSQNSCFRNLKDQLSTLMSSNDDENLTNKDEPRLQACMQEPTSLIYDQHHQETAPYFDGTLYRWP